LRILIAEDDVTCRRILEKTLASAGHDVESVSDGREALDRLVAGSFDVLITDWMMPQVDGIELIRRVRSGFQTPPVMIIVTSVDHPEANEQALGAGADDYVAKPVHPGELLSRLDACVRRTRQIESPGARPFERANPPGGSSAPLGSAGGVPAASSTRPAGDTGTPDEALVALATGMRRPAAVATRPPFPALGVTASTGGPPALVRVFEGFAGGLACPVFVVLHAPAWALDAFAKRLQQACPALDVSIAEDGVTCEPGHVYVAPGDRHLVVEPVSLRTRVIETPPENFVRPAADPLFRSLAVAFGRFAGAVVLTGMGRDGASGCAAIASVGGVAIVQDPIEAVARSMPEAVLREGVQARVRSLDSISPAVARIVRERLDDLVEGLEQPAPVDGAVRSS